MNNTSQVFLSVVVPAFQEARRIGSTLEAMGEFLAKQNYSSEILVVNDGSTDGTASVAASYQGGGIPLTLLRHEQNRGKGAAVRTGMQAARGDFILFADADNATPFEELTKLLENLKKGGDICMGSRYIRGSRVVKKQSFVRRAMSRMGNLLFRIVLGLPFADTRCGFKLFTRHARDVVFSRQTLDRWGFDTEILVIALHHGLQVREVPVEWYDRERGNIHPLRDSIRSLQEIWHIWQLKRSGTYN